MESTENSFRTRNLGPVERGMSTVAGSVLVAYGLKRRGWGGAAMAAAGAGLLRRGLTGYCGVYQRMGRNTSGEQGQHVSVPYQSGVRVDKSITVNKPRSEVYAFWRNFENLPRFMKHLQAVQSIDGKRSHWVVNAPAGQTVEWDAEVINELQDQVIGWRSLPGAIVPNAGSVRFEDAAGDRGTIVKVALQYDPPGGKVASLFAKLFGEEPSQQIDTDLRLFKAVMETGEVPTTEGQPTGTRGEQKRTAHAEKIASHGVHEASVESFPASDAPAWR